MKAVVALVGGLGLMGCGDSRPPSATGALDSSSATASAFASPPAELAAPASLDPPTTIDAAALTARMQGVVDGFAAEQSVPFYVVVEDLSTGAQVSHLADAPVLSASLYKLFVARELVRRVDAGVLRADALAGDGMNRTVDQCIEAMIVVSDNACGAAGLRLVGGGALDTALHRDGFVSTSLASPQRTSAADVALYFRELHDGTLLGASGQAGTAELDALLRAQQVDDRLPQGLPRGTPLAHKTGDRLHWAHDAGVMSTPRGDVVIVVLSGPWDAPCCDADHPGAAEARAFGAIAELGRQVYVAVS